MSLMELYRKYREVISYLFWGACTTLVNISAYWFCFNLLNIPNIPSTIISWVVAVAFAYITNRIFVFRSKSEKILAEISKFVSARLLTGLFDIAIMFFAVDMMHWTPIFWKIISNIIVIILNFILSKWFIFTSDTKSSVKTVRTKKANPKFYFACVLMILNIATLFLGLNWAKITITYLEHNPSSSSHSISHSTVLSSSEQLTQNISMPYNIFNSLAIAIDDLGQVNNSTYNVKILDSNDHVIMDKDFSPAKLPEDKILRLSNKNNISVNPDETYRLSITPKDVTEDKTVGFYHDDENSDTIYYDIYGGEYRFWWTGFIIFIFLFNTVIISRVLYLTKNNKKLFEDRFFKTLLFFGVIFVLVSVFSVGGYFTDEYDNMQAGTMISDGATLYKDYVTQHTPFAYYLCAFFHSLGAESITQFRLMFYVLYALVWAFIYFRYSKRFKAIRIVILGIVMTCILPCTYATNLQLLYDNIQMICLTVLMFEFVSYCKESKPSLDWIRSIIVALCIIISISSAFNSVFPLVAFGIGFIVIEIKYWINNKISISEFLKRYYRLFLAIILPVTGTVFYFWTRSALSDVVEQAYLFNTKVYSNYYMDGYGTNLIEPFILGINSFLTVIKDCAINLIGTRFDFNSVFHAVVLLVSIYAIFKQFREKHYVIGAVTLMAICFSFSRENFHTISAWAIMTFTCIMLFPTIKKRIAEWQWFIIIPVALFFFTPYYEYVKSFVLYEQPTVSELDKKVIDHTEEGEYVGVDSYLHDSLYFHYKGLKVANRNMYILPWYMVWYEDSVIDDYTKNQPNVLIYDPNTELWGNKDYAPRLRKYVEQNYVEDEIIPTLWIKK